MLYGICNLSIIPLRGDKSPSSEMISQVLFGEHFKVIDKNKNWSKIRLHEDGYEGYLENIQYQEISEEDYNALSEFKTHITGELVDFITDKNNHLTTICLGSNLPFYKNNQVTINQSLYHYEGSFYNKKIDKKNILNIAYLYLNAPYLWGGKTPFGIDAAGLTQMVYKLCGYQLFREAKKQATQGEVLSFIEESEPGDLAFFDDSEGNITHVGIILNDYYIIHAYGKVRIDRLDHSGIYNIDTKRHTHKLRVIKKII